ncbi:head-tail connector protein [Sphingomonas sp.]|uniref:head-tail connector protein n=1 Tax=Sphingomonas sp. TaxID=28214 RepID=UPI003B3A821B
MRVVVVDPPVPVVTWDDADKHLRLFGDDGERDYIEALIAAATAHIDGPGGWLGRAIGVQTLDAYLDNFDCGSIRLPYPPLIEVLEVEYIDANGVATLVPGTDYSLAGVSLAPGYGLSWPTPRWQREAFRVRYRAGYTEVPAPIKAAILLMVGDLYQNRETSVPTANATAVPMSTTVDALLIPYRVYV